MINIYIDSEIIVIIYYSYAPEFQRSKSVLGNSKRLIDGYSLQTHLEIIAINDHTNYGRQMRLANSEILDGKSGQHIQKLRPANPAGKNKNYSRQVQLTNWESPATKSGR